MINEDEITQKSIADINKMLKKLLAEKEEIITELKAELLESKIETVNASDPIRQAIEIINEYKNEDGTYDTQEISNRMDMLTEIVSHLSIWLLYNDDSMLYKDEYDID